MSKALFKDIPVLLNSAVPGPSNHALAFSSETGSESNNSGLFLALFNNSSIVGKSSSNFSSSPILPLSLKSTGLVSVKGLGATLLSVALGVVFFLATGFFATTFSIISSSASVGKPSFSATASSLRLNLT